MSYFIIKQNKTGQNDKYCINSAKVNLQAILQLEYTNIVNLNEV